MQSNHQVMFVQPKLKTSIGCQWNSLKNSPPTIYDDEVCIQINTANFKNVKGIVICFSLG